MLVQCNEETGRRCGESHGRSKLSDRDVEIIRRLNEQGVNYHILARSFDCSPETVGRICRCEIRNVIKVKWKKLNAK